MGIVTESGAPPVAAVPAPGAPTAVPGPGSPVPWTAPPPKRRRTLGYALIAAVIVVVLVLLFATQVIPLSPSSSSTGGSALTFSEARPIANASVAGFQDGGWYLILAAGLDSPTSESIPTNSSASGSGNCTLTLVSGASATLSIPAFTGSRTAGVAPAWEFLYRNGAGSVAVVTVVSGAASVIGTIGGTTCSFLFGLFSTLSSPVIDSSQAAAAAASDAGTFLTQHPNASAEFGLIGGVTFLSAHIGPEWDVAFTTCPIGPATLGNGTTFNATVNATNAHVTFFQTQTNVSCASSTSITLVSMASSLRLGYLSEAMRAERP
jgi:hypothetical protein